jgi:hypothetical protein
MGIFLSQCKTTVKLDSVALLSKPATDRNLFYISNLHGRWKLSSVLSILISPSRMALLSVLL